MSWEVLIMQSKTSFFNKRIFFSSLSRFWPLWGAYILVLFAIIPLPMLGGGADQQAQYLTSGGIMSEGWSGGCIVSAIMAAATAMCVFGYLYSSRHTGMMTSLPIRRGAMYFSTFSAGLAAMLASDLIIFLITLLAEAGINSVNMVYLWQWLAVTAMMNLTFYGFAAFCAMLTGNLVVLPLVYAVLEFTAWAVENLVRGLLSLFVFGLPNSGSGIMTFLSPIIKLTSGGIDVTYSGDVAVVTMAQGQWQMLGAYCAAGAVFAALGLLLYRKRRMESATDVVAVKILRPVFKYCLAVGCALVFGLWLYSTIYASRPVTVTSFCVLLLLMFAGAFIGYFAADMLMKKTFRVFSGNWKGYVILCCIGAALVLCCRFDIFGYEKHVPDAAQVKSVTIQTAGDTVELSDPDNVAAAVALHSDIAANKEKYARSDETIYSITIRYKLENGKTMVRSYDLSGSFGNAGDPASGAGKLQALINTNEAISSRKTLTLPVTVKNIRYCNISYYDKTIGGYTDVSLTPEQAVQFYTECVLPDIDDGALGRIWLDTYGSDYESKVYALTVNMDLYDSAVESAADQSAAGTKASVIGTTDQLFFTTLTVDASRTLAWIKANTKIEPILMKEYYEIYEIQSGGQNTAAAGTGKFNG
jgi:ABC-2 type transport system permease protein